MDNIENWVENIKKEWIRINLLKISGTDFRTDETSD